MQLTPADIASIRSQFSINLSSADPSSAELGKDPIGIALNKTMSSLNSLSVKVKEKIDSLEEEILKSSSNIGSVKLVGNELIITNSVTTKEVQNQITDSIQSRVDSINKSVTLLSNMAKSLNVISTTTSTLKKAVDVQEALLTFGNPAAKVTLSLIKSALRILNYKDALSEYANILSNNIKNVSANIDSLSSKFSNLTVKFIQNEDQNNGIVKTQSEVESQLQAKTFETAKSVVYQNNSGKSYVIGVEPHGTRELIAVARDPYSLMPVAQTAPSFIYSGSDLLEELKQILNQ